MNECKYLVSPLSWLEFSKIWSFSWQHWECGENTYPWNITGTIYRIFPDHFGASCKYTFNPGPWSLSMKHLRVYTWKKLWSLSLEHWRVMGINLYTHIFTFIQTQGVLGDFESEKHRTCRNPMWTLGKSEFRVKPEIKELQGGNFSITVETSLWIVQKV